MKGTGLLWFVCALSVIVMPPPAPASEIVLHNFGCPPRGAYPQAGVIADRSGNLYGTTSQGGTANKGVVYKLDTTHHQIVLHSFSGGADGAQPNAVFRDSAGNLYGTTYSGGAGNAGVVYKLDTAGNETVLYNFTGGADGGGPEAGVIRGSAGSLYGTTYNGGTANWGVVYKLDGTGHETVLYSFTGGADGGHPIAGVILDSAGNLYGTTFAGGTAYAGVVYKVDTTGHESVLYSFTGGADGRWPQGGVIRDSAGDLYGTTLFGGASDLGVVYELDTAGQETVLHSFAGAADGALPYVGVILDSAGNLYGTAFQGGPAGAGVVYKLDSAGQETVLYGFTGKTDGGGPTEVFRDSAGNLYGTTVNAGTPYWGVVYKLDAAGVETVLYSFPNGVDGFFPAAGLTGDTAGNLYGTTSNGGAADAGVVYKLDNTGHETVLYTFTGGTDGNGPFAGVIQDTAGNLYGTTRGGGAANSGVVFKVDTAGQETILYSFTGGADGETPNGVIRDSAGNLYGTTSRGGAAGWGVVYKLDTTGHETVLYSFTGGTDGGRPAAGVIRDSAGNLYGTTSQGGAAKAGVVYEVDNTGHETVLYSFTGGTDGDGPQAGVIRDSAGNLYGTTVGGGAGGAGVVYKVDTSGHETVLYAFPAGGDGGGGPWAGVIRDHAGNLYGTASWGGAAGYGVVYMVDAAGQETVLYSFTDKTDGGDPYAGLIRDSAGNLYGTTQFGGTRSGGVVFKIKP